MNKSLINFNLIVRNSPYQLLDNFSHYFKNSDFFADNQIVVIQNDNVANWLKINLAEKHGIAMKLNFMLPEQAVRKILTYFLDTTSLLYLDELRMLLEIQIKQLPSNHPIVTFIQKSAPSRKSRDKRIFELANQLAQLFHHYNHNAIDLPEAWIKDELLMKGRRRDLEKWQQELWKSIFIDNGFKSLFQIDREIKSLSPESALPQITIFGSAFLSAMEIRLFHYFSKFTQVTQCMFSPLSLNKAHTLDETIRDWGKLLIDNYQFLSAKTDLSIKENYLSDDTHDVLSIIKNTCLDVDVEKIYQEKNIDFSSFKAIGCPGKRREIEVLKNQVFDLLAKDPELKLHEIGVMALDINDYRIFIESIFSKTSHHPHISHNIIDLNYNTNNFLLDGYESILNLTGSSFHLDEVEKLLDNLRFKSKIDISDEEVKKFISLAKKLNIFWGMNEQHRRELKKGGGEHNTWHQGLNRVILGGYYQKDNVEEKNSFDQSEDEVAGNNYFLKSFSLLDRELEENSIKIFSFLNDLYLDTKDLNDLELTMRDWVELSKGLIEEYLSLSHPSPVELFHEKRLSNTFAQLIELSNKSNDPLLSFESFKLHWREQVVKKSANRGAYLTEGIAFSSLKPMRSIPFKHIFLLGLNEKNFPREDSASELDLSFYAPIKKGLSYDKNQVDKFCFLETLACAEKSLHVFYHHKELQNHNHLHPSSLISQLTEVLAKKLALSTEEIWENIYEEHPLHSFDAKYFFDESKIKNYSLVDYETAAIFSTPAIFSKPIKQATTKVKIESIDIKDLLLLFNEPTHLFLRQGMGTNFFQQKILLHEQEKTEIPYFKWIEYLSDLPHQPLDFERYLKRLTENDFILNNHFDRYPREEKKKKTLDCFEAFREIGMMEKEKFLYTLMPDVDEKNHQYLLSSPEITLGDQNLVIAGELSFCYEGNILFGFSREKKVSGFSYLRHYLEALLLCVCHEKKTQEKTLYKLIAFNPDWKIKTVSMEITLFPDQAKAILSSWLDIYRQHLQNPLALYLSPIWGKLENIEDFSKEDILKLIKQVFSNFTSKGPNQKEYLYQQVFDDFESPDIPWVDVKKIFQPLLEG